MKVEWTGGYGKRVEEGKLSEVKSPGSHLIILILIF